MTLRLFLTAFISVLAAGPAAAQTRDFPQRSIRIVAPVPPGGSVDIVSRLIARKLSDSLGQSVVVDNRGGASTNIGMEIVARAPADGYTLLANTIALVANPSLFPKLPFDVEKDFLPVSLIVNGPSIIVAHPSVPARNVKELIALAKARPGVVKYSSGGTGTLTHLGAELFKYMTRSDMVHVPYKGGGPAIAALMSGECDVSFQTVLATAGQVAAGRLRALAVTGRRRLEMLPEVATVAESGVPNYEFQSWVGILAPAATPPAIVKVLNDHIVKAARTPDVSESFVRDGSEVVASTPEYFRKLIAAEIAMWAKVIKEMGLKVE